MISFPIFSLSNPEFLLWFRVMCVLLGGEIIQTQSTKQVLPNVVFGKRDFGGKVSRDQ